ncbi:DUF218 domain-containing protein [Pilibacter termitis]|uniref:DUF218 domain-containing protein n=1 Tax=Pilibacter termitis TaxID=263852 RepID=A0A1T4PLQ0_9ENTE|nr:YdcF family protein [Pilibacter termitis]SJZ92186.1 DUF218 domain-containing protein [Pilibacter termitis]
MKKLVKIVGCFVAFGVLYACVMFGLILSDTKSVAAPHADKMLILGAGVFGKTPSEARPSPVLKERLDTALLYLKKNPETKVIVSGGQGVDEPISEAECMENYLILHGIAPTHIIKEEKSRDTVQNMKNSKKWIEKGESVAIVTNDFHTFRSKMLARRCGVENASLESAPSTTAVTPINYCREVLALGYALIFDR